MTIVLGIFTFLRQNWKLALVLAALVALMVLKLRWTSAGRALEAAAQAERNRRAREEAENAHRRALDDPDYRRSMRDKYSRPDAE